jgi:hypothetical protein
MFRPVPCSNFLTPAFAGIYQVGLPLRSLCCWPCHGRPLPQREISKFDTQFDGLATFDTQFAVSSKFDTRVANCFKKRDSPHIILFPLHLALFSHVTRPKYPWLIYTGIRDLLSCSHGQDPVFLELSSRTVAPDGDEP